MNYKRESIITIMCFSLVTSAGCVPDEIYIPSGGGRQPAVIVLHSSYGVSPHEREFAGFLLSKGYVALVVDYFAEGGVDNIEVGYDSLKSNPRVDSERIGIVGFSKGAKQAITFVQYSHDFTDRRIKGIVSFYIGPNVPIGPTVEHPATLFLHGDQDAHTSPKLIHNFCDGKSEEDIVCEIHIYLGVRHAFDRAHSPYNGYNSTAAADSWNRAVSFLDDHVKNAVKR